MRRSNSNDNSSCSSNGNASNGNASNSNASNSNASNSNSNSNSNSSGDSSNGNGVINRRGANEVNSVDVSVAHIADFYQRSAALKALSPKLAWGRGLGEGAARPFASPAGFRQTIALRDAAKTQLNRARSRLPLTPTLSPGAAGGEGAACILVFGQDQTPETRRQRKMHHLTRALSRHLHSIASSGIASNSIATSNIATNSSITSKSPGSTATCHSRKTASPHSPGQAHP